MEDGILEVVFLLASFSNKGDSGENAYLGLGAEKRKSTMTIKTNQMCGYALIRETS